MVWLQKLFTKTDNDNILSDKTDERDWLNLDPQVFGRSKIFLALINPLIYMN